MAAKLLTISEVAKILGVTTRTVQTYVAKRTIIPPSRMGRPRWEAARLDAWLHEGCPDPATWKYRPKRR